MISTSFSSKLNDISQELGMNPRDLLLVMYLESGVNPSAKNPHGGATGLIQFMPDTLKGMGLSKDQVSSFGQKSAEEQLDYVKQYVQGHRGLIGGQPFTSATQYYIANFWPIALKKWNGTDPNENKNVVIVSANSNNPAERAAYKENKILDTNNDGVITVGDITNILMRMEQTKGFQNMLTAFNSVAGQGMVSEKGNQDYEQKPQDTQVANFLSQVETFLNSVSNSKEPITIIKVLSDKDFSSKLEYCRILSLALKEELNIKSELYIYNNSPEIKCLSNDNNKIKELCVAVSDTFNSATKKIGGINILTELSDELTFNSKPIDIKIAEINYRKFNLKFLGNSGE